MADFDTFGRLQSAVMTRGGVARLGVSEVGELINLEVTVPIRVDEMTLT